MNTNSDPRKTFLHQSVLYQMVMLVSPDYGFVRNKSYDQSCTHNAKNVTKLRSAEKRPEDQKITVFGPKLMIYDKNDS